MYDSIFGLVLNPTRPLYLLVKHYEIYFYIRGGWDVFPFGVELYGFSDKHVAGGTLGH